MTTMKKNDINRSFLSLVDEKTKLEILSSIAKDYGASNDEVYQELVNEEAELMLDYMLEPCRSATYILMQRHNLV